MIVSHANRFIFIHNPKCAGSSLRERLQQYHEETEAFWGRRFVPYLGCERDFAHLRLWEMHMLFPDIFFRIPYYRSLVLVRNPYERFLSSLAEYISTYKPDFDVDRTPPAAHCRMAAEIIEHELRMETVIGDVKFVHFSPQTWYILVGQRRLVRHVPRSRLVVMNGVKCLPRSTY